MAIAVVIVLLVVGSVVFHFVSPWWFTEIASHWTSVDFTINLTFWVTGFVFVAVNLFLAYSVFRYRQRKGEASKAVYEPENARLETGLTVLTTLGVAAMLAPGLFVWAQFVSVPEEATEFEAFGSQWQWAFRYPGDDGVLGTADIEHITETNPWGINPDDPNGQDDRGHQEALYDAACRPAGESPAAFAGCPAQLHSAPVPHQDGHGSRHGLLPVADANPHRGVRYPV